MGYDMLSHDFESIHRSTPEELLKFYLRIGFEEVESSAAISPVEGVTEPGEARWSWVNVGQLMGGRKGLPSGEHTRSHGK